MHTCFCLYLICLCKCTCICTFKCIRAPFKYVLGPFYICIGEILDLNWGGGIIGERIMYVQMRMYVDMGLDPQESIKDPNAAEKEPQLC